MGHPWLTACLVHGQVMLRGLLRGYDRASQQSFLGAFCEGDQLGSIQRSWRVLIWVGSPVLV